MTAMALLENLHCTLGMTVRSFLITGMFDRLIKVKGSKLPLTIARYLAGRCDN